MTLELNRLHNIDCMEFMKSVPNKYFDFVFTDPPYGLQSGKSIYNGGGLHTKSVVKFGSRFNMANSCNNKKWDYEKPSDEYFLEIKRISKHQIIFGGNYFPKLSPCRGFIIWNKKQVVNNFSHAEYIFTSIDMPSKVYDCRKFGIFADTISIHPTEKPVALLKTILKNHTNPGDKIFDSHAGSASLFIACLETGRDYIGCELDREYFDAASKRVANFKKQNKLFDEKFNQLELQI